MNKVAKRDGEPENENSNKVSVGGGHNNDREVTSKKDYSVQTQPFEVSKTKERYSDDLIDIVERFKDNPELLKMILVAKTEESKAKAGKELRLAEELRLEQKKADLAIVKNSKGYDTFGYPNNYDNYMAFGEPRVLRQEGLVKPKPIIHELKESNADAGDRARAKRVAEHGEAINPQDRPHLHTMKNNSGIVQFPSISAEDSISPEEYMGPLNRGVISARQYEHTIPQRPGRAAPSHIEPPIFFPKEYDGFYNDIDRKSRFQHDKPFPFAQNPTNVMERVNKFYAHRVPLHSAPLYRHEYDRGAGGAGGGGGGGYKRHYPIGMGERKGFEPYEGYDGRYMNENAGYRYKANIIHSAKKPGEAEVTKEDEDTIKHKEGPTQPGNDQRENPTGTATTVANQGAKSRNRGSFSTSKGFGGNGGGLMIQTSQDKLKRTHTGTDGPGSSSGPLSAPVEGVASKKKMVLREDVILALRRKILSKQRKTGDNLEEGSTTNADEKAPDAKKLPGLPQKSSSEHLKSNSGAEPQQLSRFSTPTKAQPQRKPRKPLTIKNLDPAQVTKDLLSDEIASKLPNSAPLMRSRPRTLSGNHSSAASRSILSSNSQKNSNTKETTPPRPRPPPTSSNRSGKPPTRRSPSISFSKSSENNILLTTSSDSGDDTVQKVGSSDSESDCASVIIPEEKDNLTIPESVGVDNSKTEPYHRQTYFQGGNTNPNTSPVSDKSTQRYHLGESKYIDPAHSGLVARFRSSSENTTPSCKNDADMPTQPSSTQSNRTSIPESRRNYISLDSESPYTNIVPPVNNIGHPVKTTLPSVSKFLEVSEHDHRYYTFRK